MENLNQPVIKKNYKTIKEAFQALPEATKQHSIRVAEYTKALFIQAVAVEMRLGDDKAGEQLDPDYERGAYLCGLYHDIGKVLVPVEYHVKSADFTAEEDALYKKHTQDGAAMIRQMVFGEDLSEVEQDMILEAIEFHHQIPDGTGFPECETEDDILPMALLVSFANVLDHLVTQRRSETPFEDVIKELMASFPDEKVKETKPEEEMTEEEKKAAAEEEEEPVTTELYLVIRESLTKLRRVFLKYQDQSLKIPTVLPFVKRKNNRPFELKYRPIMDRKRKETVGLQAKMYFKDNKDTFVEFEEVKHILTKNKLIPEVGRYFIYEAGDMVKRIQACELPIEYVALELMPKYFTQAKAVTALKQQLEDARMEPGKLVISLDESLFMDAPKAFVTNVERMAATDIAMMVTGWQGRFVTADDIIQYKIGRVALHPDMYPRLEEDEVGAQIQKMQDAGVEVLAGEYEKTKYNGMLNSLEITAMTGPLAGEYLTEDEIILGELKLKLNQ